MGGGAAAEFVLFWLRGFNDSAVSRGSVISIANVVQGWSMPRQRGHTLLLMVFSAAAVSISTSGDVRCRLTAGDGCDVVASSSSSSRPVPRHRVTHALHTYIFYQLKLDANAQK